MRTLLPKSSGNYLKINSSASLEPLDYFGLKSADELFKEVQSVMREYNTLPTKRLFLFLVFSMNHLREWISGGITN